MWQLAFEVFVGKFAEVTAGILGILGSVALAVPPIESLRLRTVLLQLFSVHDVLSPEVISASKGPLLAKAKHLLAREQVFNIVGACLLFLSFAILSVHSLYFALAQGGGAHHG